ncbi:MAG: aspartate--tRNA(Asn) ligase [Candidatus Borkfalkiaceae bacterium]|nr:aspartate--tRNA(Asn) ligase [Clostridia bacterium]MDY6224038.1 aspartate--tRNA(Asn) ligase [Christensenellaceae bacterium]
MVITGEIKKDTVDFIDFEKYENQEVTIKGTVHNIRMMSDFAFVILRTARETVQCVYSEEFSSYRMPPELKEECAVKVTGKVVAGETREGAKRYELQIHNVEILSHPAAISPVVITKKQVQCDLNTNLDYRPVTLRNPRERAIFKIQEGIQRGFREFLISQNFTEVHTPKINFAGAEGGTNVFKLDYFGKQVYLAQSPQLYKQALVGVYERVFEIAPVFRAERHDTSRHLNEYISMDFEMGFIDGFEDIMNMETGALKYIMNLLKTEYAGELALLHADVPEITEIPAIKFMDAKEVIMKQFRYQPTDMKDFDPAEEEMLGKYAKKKFNSDFLFVTHYPSKKRPFYTMDDPEDPEYTLSFDLLFRGLEITSGGQRVHDYNEQVAKMKRLGMNPDEFETYLMLHKYGAPPHGGLGIGLERLTMHLLGFKNVREATMFPRDINRVTP